MVLQSKVVSKMGTVYSEAGRVTDAEAFRRLIELSSHYARLLNDYDGGHRRIFKTTQEWIERLEHIEELGTGMREKLHD